MLWPLINLIDTRKLDELVEQDGWTFMHVREVDLHFDRLWRPIDDISSPSFNYKGHRLWAHRLPTSSGQPFWHPHPWPMGVIVLGPDPYTVHFSHAAHRDTDCPPEKTISVTSRGCFMYEMVDPTSWHAIQPQGTVFSLMLSGPSWDTWRPQPEPHKPPVLSDARQHGLYRMISRLFERQGAMVQ